mgnify:CR=1 FL=1
MKAFDFTAVQYINYYTKWLKTSTQILKKTLGKPKLVPRFAAGTSNKYVQLDLETNHLKNDGADSCREEVKKKIHEWVNVFSKCFSTLPNADHRSFNVCKGFRVLLLFLPAVL